MKDELITIYEDYPSVISNMALHKTNLYYLREHIGSQNLTLEVDGTLTVRRFIGFFARGCTRLQILPKIHSPRYANDPVGSEPIVSLDYIFRLLHWSEYMTNKPLQPQFQDEQNTDFLEIFIDIFITEYLRLIPRHIHHTYETFDTSLPYVKGKIDVQDTLRKHLLTPHKHSLHFDEYTVDNSLNQIFKSLMRLLLRRARNQNNKRRLVRGLSYLDEVTSPRLSNSLFQNVNFDRLNSSFEPLFNLARLFFLRRQPGISYGETETFCFLVQLNLLFETFVGKVLKALSGPNNSFGYHKPRKHLARLHDQGKFLLEPDFTFTNQEKTHCILDTKHKCPFDTSGKVEISNGDLYQLVTYATAYQCNRLFLIYPKFIWSPCSDTLLEEYTIDSAQGTIHLTLIQIDLLQKTFESMVESIRPYLPCHFDH